MGIPRHAFMTLAVSVLSAAALAQEFYAPPNYQSAPIAGWGALNPSAAEFPNANDVYPPASPLTYPDTGLSSVFDTNGWPVAMPFGYYPQGVVNPDGTGISATLMATDCPADCFCTPPPCYFGTFYAAGIVLERDTNLRPAGLIFDATLTTELPNASDFNLGTEAGFRIGVWLTNPCGIDWNIEYFGVEDFDDSIVVEDPATVNAIFFGDSFPVAPTSITAEYESSLASVEFMLRARQSCRLAPLVGMRFLEVDENFNLLDDVDNRTGMLSSTDNDLYGVQFGFQGLIHQWSRTRLEATLKGGVYYNDIAVAENIYDGTTTTTFSDDTSWSAFSGDARLTLVCQLGPRMNFRIGYQALWLDGIALAVNQNTVRSFEPPVQVVDISDVLYQGGEIGFDLSW